MRNTKINIFEKKYNKLLIFLIMFSIFCSFLLLNSKTPPMGEDLILIPWGAGDRPGNVCEAFSRICSRIREQSAGWNVRFGEQLSIVFAALPKQIFHVLNSGMVLLYICLIYWYAFKRKIIYGYYHALQLLICWTMIICAQPVLGEIFFWRTGSANYLWAICLLLAFGIPLRYYIGNESIDLIGTSVIRCILLTIAGFFAGFTNENTVIVFLVLYIGTIVFDRIRRRRTPIWIFLSGTSFFCGAMYMYVAPSTKVRRQIYDQMYGITEVSFQDYYMRALKVIHRFFYDNRILVLLTGILVFWHYMYTLSDKNITLPARKKKLIYSAENLMLLLLTSISCGVLILNPYIETRAFLLPDFFMMVCVLYYFEQLYLFIKKKAVLTGTLTAILAGSLVIEVTHIYHTYNNYYNYVQLRCQAIAEQNDEDTFIWGAYQGEDYSRVLTTREDYLMNENTRLSYYFGKKIQPLRNYIWGFSIDESFEKVHIEGGLDTFWYNREDDSVELTGWAAKKEDDAENNSYYVYLDSGQQRFYFKTNRISRKDIADAYGNNIYLNSGFCYTIESVSEVVGDTELENVRAGFCVVDEKNGWFGEQEEGKIYEVVDHSPLF
uniref:Glycosyltransferase RgtA/B/C/D-like domain-containing protein n=1 Tax=Eubacterium plexicaudatum ASF492 TaxID=1235802 RepID=N1ZXA1_9FIRM